MFYGDFSDINKKVAFRMALDTIAETFTSIYAADNLIAIEKAAGFFKDEKFKLSFEKYADTDQEKSLGWRLHTLVWATRHCLDIPGDFVECGVLRGFSSAVIADYHGFESVNKSMYLYDTFEGKPAENNGPYEQYEVHAKMNTDDKESVYRYVLNRFGKYKNVIITKGILPQTLEIVCPAEISFMHIDLNSADAEIGVLEVLFDRVSPGGIIVLDDYGWLAYEKQKIVEDEFFGRRNHSVLELPTGQGLVIKRNSTY
jgi:hypothetical protein